MAETKTSNDSLEVRVARIEARLDGMKEQIEDVKARLDRMDKRVTEGFASVKAENRIYMGILVVVLTLISTLIRLIG